MKTVLTIFLLLFSLNGYAADAVKIDDIKVNCEAILKTGNKELIAQRGCCSHHHGVAGCSGGRVTCNDGTLSPSCTCNSIIPIENAIVGLEI